MKKQVLLFLLFNSIFGFSQLKVSSGDFKNLKGISACNVIFDYKDLRVHGFDTEEAYLKEKMEKRQEKEGETEKFKENWYADRKKKYEPKFIEYINKRF